MALLPHCLSVIINPISNCIIECGPARAEAGKSRGLHNPETCPKENWVVMRHETASGENRNHLQQKQWPREGEQHVRGKRLTSSYLATGIVSTTMLMMFDGDISEQRASNSAAARCGGKRSSSHSANWLELSQSLDVLVLEKIKSKTDYIFKIVNKICE